MADDRISPSNQPYQPLSAPAGHFNGQVNGLESSDPSPYRITPGKCFSHPFAKLNWVMAFIGPLVGNIGIGFALLHQYSYVGVFAVPDVDNADTSDLVLDFILTSFVVVFLMSVFTGLGSKKAISQGRIAPMEEFYLSRFPFNLVPATRLRRNALRALLIGLQACFFWGGFSLLIIYGICRSGSMEGGDSSDTCMIPVTPYIIIKGVWAGFEGIFFFPFIFVGSLNKEALSQEQYQQFLVNVRLRETLNSDSFSSSTFGQLSPEANHASVNINAV